MISCPIQNFKFGLSLYIGFVSMTGAICGIRYAHSHGTSSIVVSLMYIVCYALYLIVL